MWNAVFETLEILEIYQDIEIILLKEEPELSPVDREYVLFFMNECWRAIGPIDMTASCSLISVLRYQKTRCFICSENEFVDKGMPSDALAVTYFPGNELDW